MCCAPILGQSQTAAGHDWEADTVAVLENQSRRPSIPKSWADLWRKPWRPGALDVFHTPIQMKKNRPGVLLTVLCPAGDGDRFTEIILRETSAFGVRRHVSERRKLRRETVTVKNGLR